ncbi:hypothetical protein TcWFU_003369 [Taenia crassiceps]|uniref:Uncharacterized protein n=1 Tax=Taenia crassiceps TaxID=6207 RepID=A0ABR4QQB8_9CEST
MTASRCYNEPSTVSGAVKRDPLPTKCCSVFGEFGYKSPSSAFMRYLTELEVCILIKPVGGVDAPQLRWREASR